MRVRTGMYRSVSLWRNWQTRVASNHLPSQVFGFDPRQAHYTTGAKGNMSKSQATMKLLIDRRDRLKADMEALRARLDEVEGLIRAMSGAPVPEQAVRAKRGDLKEIILSLYDEAAEAGLSSQECVAAASTKRGVLLQPASVSSALSRFKADGVLMFDGERYRLKRFAGPRSASA